MPTEVSAMATRSVGSDGVIERVGANDAIVGTSAALKYVNHRVAQVAPTNARLGLTVPLHTAAERALEELGSKASPPR